MQDEDFWRSLMVSNRVASIRVASDSYGLFFAYIALNQADLSMTSSGMRIDSCVLKSIVIFFGRVHLQSYVTMVVLCGWNVASLKCVTRQVCQRCQTC